MRGNLANSEAEYAAIGASWQRCEQEYKLTPNAADPILRLQASEIAPRLEETIERMGGRYGIFQQLKQVIASNGHCLVITDADGVVVRLENQNSLDSVKEWHGIGLGSCWDERLAGTNGVSMALAQKSAFTVKGKDHYFSALRGFSCTAVPLYDAENRVVGAVNIAAFDTNNLIEHEFSKYLLEQASNRIQCILFEKKFKESTVLSVASQNRTDLLLKRELIAVNEAGKIVGATAQVHELVGRNNPTDLYGEQFENLFGTNLARLDTVPEHGHSIPNVNGFPLTIRSQVPLSRTYLRNNWQPESHRSHAPVRTRLRPSFYDLSRGSKAMASACSTADRYFRRSIPFVIQGETGTGKSVLLRSLHKAAKVPAEQKVTVDCAIVGEKEEDQKFLNTIFEQAKVANSFKHGQQNFSTLIFEEIDELPVYAQALLRNLLQKFENFDHGLGAENAIQGLRIVATTNQPLVDAVAKGIFREDLYYLLSNTSVQLPALRDRERLDLIARGCAAQIAGHEVEITSEALDIMRAHQWPGNIRELRNVIQHGLIEGNGKKISPLELKSIIPETSIGVKSTHNPSPMKQSTNPIYSEQAMIADALQSATWNITQAAKKLGMGRATLHRKLKKYGIQRER